jgi:dTDP-4-dehydrorhamnose reductase
MNILVLGKDGQLGKAYQGLFQSLLVPAGVQIQYLGRAQCDLSRPEALLEILEQFKPNLIINTAAYTAVDKAETEADLAYAINATAPEQMAIYAVKHGATLLHYSTDYVFDGSKSGFYVEDDARNPLGVYGKSKAAGELAIEKIFAQSSSGQFAIFRTSWVYGEGGNFIRTILRLAKERDELKVIQDQYGVPTSANWLAKTSLDLALDFQWQLRQFASGVYHAVPSGETSWHSLACLAVEEVQKLGIPLKAQVASIKPILAVEYPLPAPRPMNSRMDTAKLRAALGQSLSKTSNSYNDSRNEPIFPEWDGLVKEYLSQLQQQNLL